MLYTACVFLFVRVHAAGALADGSFAVISAVPIAVALLGLLLALLAKLLLETAASGTAWETMLSTLKQEQ